MSLILGLEYDNEYDPRVRNELEQLTAAIQTAFNGLNSRPYCVLYALGVQSIPTATRTLVTYTAIDTDPFGMANAAAGTITIPPTQGGVYLVSGRCPFAADATGVRVAELRRNAGNANFAVDATIVGAATMPAFAGATTTCYPFALLSLNGGDVINQTVIHTSAGNLDIGSTVARGYQSSLIVIRLI